VDAFSSCLTDHTINGTGTVADTHESDRWTCREALRQVEASDDRSEIHNGKARELR
jgi:hypothetical protein